MWNNPHLLIMDEPSNFLDRDSLGGLATAIRDFRGGVVMISHNEELVGALCPEQWHIEAGRVTHKGHLAVTLDRFEDAASASASPFGSRPGSSMGNHLGSHLGSGGPPSSSNVSSAAASAAASAVNSEAEGDMKFKQRKKKKMTRAQLKDRESRRRLRHIEWLNSPKGTPKPPDTDDEAE
jgi:elongation factor 3